MLTVRERLDTIHVSTSFTSADMVALQNVVLRDIMQARLIGSCRCTQIPVVLQYIIC
jgi:hypothetical protein